MNRVQTYIYGLSFIVSIIILADFLLPGKAYSEEVIDVKKKREQYYNAARNHHYSYKIVTSKHSFSISEDFAKSALNQTVNYKESLLFKEINHYELESAHHGETYSFRYISGLILPLLVMLIIAILHKTKKELTILIFVLQVLLLGNLIMLIVV